MCQGFVFGCCLCICKQMGYMYLLSNLAPHGLTGRGQTCRLEDELPTKLHCALRTLSSAGPSSRTVRLHDEL